MHDVAKLTADSCFLSRTPLFAAPEAVSGGQRLDAVVRDRLTVAKLVQHAWRDRATKVKLTAASASSASLVSETAVDTAALLRDRDTQLQTLIAKLSAAHSLPPFAFTLTTSSGSHVIEFDPPGALRGYKYVDSYARHEEHGVYCRITESTALLAPSKVKAPQTGNLWRHAAGDTRDLVRTTADPRQHGTAPAATTDESQSQPPPQARLREPTWVDLRNCVVYDIVLTNDV
jgi:hypothetical protein